MSDLLDRSRNRWRDLLLAFGIQAKHLTGKNCPCPMCGGRDRFRFLNTNGDGTWVCNQCDAGNGISLLMRFKGWDFRTLASEVEAIIGSTRERPTKPQRSERQIRDDNNRLWRSGRPVTASDPVGLYLNRRTGLVATPPAIRYVPKAVCHGSPSTDHPAMISMVTDAAGHAVTLHRTFLTADGRKADVERPRRFMPGTVPDGVAVRLYPTAPELGIAEGIETAFSAANLFGLPVWSALDANHLRVWTPPFGVEKVVVFADNDLSFTGQNAAFALAQRLSLAGLKARVEIPPRPDSDWNDVLLQQGEAA